MNITDLLTIASRKLKDSDIENPLFEAEYLLAFTLGKDKLYIKTHLTDSISKEHEKEYFKHINLRSKDYPIAYITGTREFFGLDFFIEEGVLIPRPETELLVETTLKHIKSDSPIIADIGTGSGAIAIALAKNLPKSHIYALDISDKALEVANKNAKYHKMENQITFVKSDYLTEIKHKTFHAIVSNPPYIKTKIIRTLQKGVKDFEPKIALDGGEDGLEAYKTIIPNAINLINEEGIIILEIGFDQKDDLIEIAEKHKLKISIYKDIYENNRVVLIGK